MKIKKYMSEDVNKKPLTEWEEDCLHFWGKVLTGKYRHWCPEYDDLPIDETCDEFKHCICYEDELKQKSPA